MNKRQILASLNNIANTLDHSGFNREADTITKVMVKLAEEETESYGNEPAKKIIDDFVDQAKRNERYDPNILKMMNDRLEFNKHETMSEEKFRKMIGKNKEANSIRSMKKLAADTLYDSSISEQQQPEENYNAESDERLEEKHQSLLSLLVSLAYLLKSNDPYKFSKEMIHTYFDSSKQPTIEEVNELFQHIEAFVKGGAYGKPRGAEQTPGYKDPLGYHKIKEEIYKLTE